MAKRINRTADEEWMSSSIKEKSVDKLKSGMLLQIDIIPSVPAYAGVSCEVGGGCFFIFHDYAKNNFLSYYPFEIYKITGLLL